MVLAGTFKNSTTSGMVITGEVADAVSCRCLTVLCAPLLGGPTAPSTIIPLYMGKLSRTFCARSAQQCARSGKDAPTLCLSWLTELTGWLVLLGVVLTARC